MMMYPEVRSAFSPSSQARRGDPSINTLSYTDPTVNYAKSQNPLVSLLYSRLQSSEVVIQNPTIIRDQNLP